MPDASLLLLLDEVRGKTLRILEAAPAEFGLWAPPGLRNHITWHAGHAYVVVESLAMRALGRPPVLPDGWFAMFSWDSDPARVPRDRWPPLGEIIARLREQRARLKRILAGLTDSALEAPAAGSPSRSVRYAILHGLHDEACHSGEMYLLLKMQARSRPD